MALNGRLPAARARARRRNGLLDVVVGGLDELEQDVLDVLANVSGLGQGGGDGSLPREPWCQGVDAPSGAGRARA